ncbi:MAG TPA: hypothetical protein GXX40_05610 [Firmicutes bacterium]|nr:hypothetical protein [Bacillota bacterium]
MTVSPKMIDWLLYNLVALRQQVNALEPKTSTSVVVLCHRGGHNPDSMIERVAIRRAAVSSVLDAVERGIRLLHPEQRRIYRMKYRAGMTYKQIKRRLFLSDKTVQRRVEEIRSVVGQCLASVPPGDLKEFDRFFSSGP